MADGDSTTTPAVTSPAQAKDQPKPATKDGQTALPGEAYPGHFGGYKGSEPRELAERTPEERDLIDNQGHTIADAMRIAGSENALEK